MTTINSVLGPISSDDLGFTLMHEHVMVSAPAMFRTYPDLFGPEDREARAIDTFKKVKAEGIDTIVDATTYDLGGDASTATVGIAISERFEAMLNEHFD